MKHLTVILVVIIFFAACNNATDQGTAGPDTTSSFPSPATIDTNSLKPDSPNVEKALRK